MAAASWNLSVAEKIAVLFPGHPLICNASSKIISSGTIRFTYETRKPAAPRKWSKRAATLSGESFLDLGGAARPPRSAVCRRYRVRSVWSQRFCSRRQPASVFVI